jgi:excisionase family DNA binding protein
MTATRVYTVEQVAEHLSVTPDKVRAWLRTGYIRGFKLGPREWRVADDDLEAFIQRLRVESGAGAADCVAEEADSGDHLG